MVQGVSKNVNRVALVLSELRAGGAERVVVHLASTLPTLGAAAEIICMQNPGNLAADAEVAGVKVIALHSFRGYDVRAIWRLATQLRRFRPDVINVHDRSSLPYVVLANIMSGRHPVVFSAHGLLVRDEGPRLRDRLSGGHLAAVTAVSQPAAQEYAHLLGWSGEVDVIDNGVPPVKRSEVLRHEFRQSLGLREDTFVYVAVGNVKPEKGFEDLLSATVALREQCGGRQFTVLIAGGTADKEYHASLLAQQEKTRLDGAVRFLGFQSHVESLYSAADAFVLSSRKEGLPLVLLEAMSAGLPIVATEVGAVPDVIRHNVDGLLVPPASAGQLAQAMFRLSSDEALRTLLGTAARARIESRYSVRHMAEQYMEVYSRARVESACHVQALPSPPTPLPKIAGSLAVRPTVLMLGPLPPLTGGMATVACNLRDSALRQWCELETMNNGKTTPEGRSFFAGVWAQTRLLYAILSTIRRRHVRVVHIHTCALFSFWRDVVHMIAVRMLGCRLVWHLHDGTFPRFISEGSRTKRAVIRWALRRAAATIVLGHETLEALRPHAPGVQWQVVPNGIPLRDGRTKDMPATDGTNASLKLLFLGNLTRRKGAYDLIAAVEAAASQGVHVVLMLAGGEGSPGQRREIEQRIADSPCAGQIRLLGIVHGEKKHRALDEADCIVLPSYAEGLPMALLEGMAAGLPAIATRIGSIPALVVDGVEGFLVPAGDINALAERICRLARNPELRRSMGQAARQRVEKHFSQQAMAERVYHIYCAAITEENRPTDEHNLQSAAAILP
jgi:glycosyltransferase involved in cell wall biosynthesis